MFLPTKSFEKAISKNVYTLMNLRLAKRSAFLVTVGAVVLCYQIVAQETPSRNQGKQALRLATKTETGSLAAASLQVNNDWMTLERCPVFTLESIELPSQESGVIAALDVIENDNVVANQIIAKLDTKVAELEKGVAGLQSQVATAEANDESEIRLAEAFMEEAQLQVDIYEEMTSKGNSSDFDLRQKQLALAQTKVRITQARASKQQKELRAKLAQASVFLGQQKADRLILRSPIAGTVVKIDHRPGEWVQAGTTLVKIIRLDELRVDCFVDINQLDPATLINQPVSVVVNRGQTENQFVGKITSFDPDVSSTGSVRVHATIQNQKSGDHWLLLPGMTVKMQLAHVRTP